jgi:hypothetical protein
MARGRRPATQQSPFKIQELDIKEAQRRFSKSRGRGSKYDDIIEAAEGLAGGKALIVGGLTYSNVLGLRKRVQDHLGEDWAVESTKVDKDSGSFEVLIHKKK